MTSYCSSLPMAAGPLRPEHPRSRQTQLLLLVLPMLPCIQLCTAAVSRYPLGLLRTPSRHEDARAREAAAASCDPVACSNLPSGSLSPVVSLLSLTAFRAQAVPRMAVDKKR